MKQYRPFIVSILCVGIIILPGCAGRNCTPIEIKLNSDENLSCSRLSAEMEKLEADHMKLKEEADGKLVWNIFMFVTGFVIIVPFFLMDLKGAAECELSAVNERHDHLKIISKSKGCEVTESETASK